MHAYTPGQRPVQPDAALAGLLVEVGVDARYLPESLEGRTGLWRDRMAGQRAVLVLDNAASSDQVTPLLPGGEGCLVLITSRRYLGDLPGAVVPVLLDVLPPDKAQAMFLQLAARAAPAPESSVRELVRLAGYLPLAISLLARVYVRHLSWTLDDLIGETTASLLTLTAERDSVAAAFDVSYRYLAPGLQDFFRCLGLHPGTTIDAYAAAALAGEDPLEAARHLDALHGEGLLTEVSYRRYSMHDLIRNYARDLAAVAPEADREQILGRLTDYYQHTANRAEDLLTRQTRSNQPPALGNPPAGAPSLLDSSQALAWARAERANILACLDKALAAGQQARIVALTAAIAALMSHDGPWSDAITRHTAAIEAARVLHDLPGQARALSNLGVMHRRSGNYPAAAQAAEEALGIYGDTGDQLEQANSLADLAVVQWLTGDYLQASQTLARALGIYRDTGDRRGQANSLADLAVVRWLTGDLPGAAQAAEEALGIYRNIGDQLGQANSLLHLGGVQRIIGNHSSAVQAAEAALSLYRDLDDRRGQAGALADLGAVRLATRNYPAATQALEEALGISRDLGDRRGRARALSSLGTAQRSIGNFPAAAQALEDALDIYRDLGDRGGMAETLNEAGTLHLARDDLDLAGQYHQRALNLAREIYSPWDEATALAGLGRCALAAGLTTDAIAGLQQAREIFHRIGAVEASDVAAELDALNESGPGT